MGEDGEGDVEGGWGGLFYFILGIVPKESSKKAAVGVSQEYPYIVKLFRTRGRKTMGIICHSSQRSGGGGSDSYWDKFVSSTEGWEF